MMMNQSTGKSYPLGATIENNGVNFCVFAPEAKKIELLLFDNTTDINPSIYTLSSEVNKTNSYWHIFIANIVKNQHYGYRVHGEFDPTQGKWFDGTKILVDPYAKAIVGEYDRQLNSTFEIHNLQNCLKSVVISDEFDWEKDTPLNTPISKSIIYEMHLAGFTKSAKADVPNRFKGTYSGLIEKIPYLKSLGVTAIELLPIYAFDKQDAPGHQSNYWGYSPINFFALHTAYASVTSPQAIVDEFKHLIKTLHTHGIEVILDVVYNHTTENDAFTGGPTLCMRGFANSSYYLLEANGKFKNHTGTGNTINANHSVVRRMIMDSLHYWKQIMHVDGFRFDLASTLSRDESGKPMINPPILWDIDSSPILAETKIIAEPWDASGLHQVKNFAGDRWVIWNDKFRDTTRKYVKGDASVMLDLASRFLGSEKRINARYIPFKPHQNLHFVTCHDGFTMIDLVSYNQKHNKANGENNQDGANQNYSWNCGIEGPTNDPEIKRLRHRQTRNFMAILLLSHGTPMLNMGDELQRSQLGNNNVYSQDNPLGWMNWEIDSEKEKMLLFTQKMIRFRKNHSIFSFPEYYSKQENNHFPYVTFHGVQQNLPDWNTHSHALAIQLTDIKNQENLYLIFNMYHESLPFDLPSGNWKLVIDTYTYQNDDSYIQVMTGQVKCEARSILILEKLVPHLDNL